MTKWGDLLEIDHSCTKCHKHQVKKFLHQEVLDKKYPIEDKTWQCPFCFTWQNITKEGIDILKQRAAKEQLARKYAFSSN